jgi:hypothetical protein
MQPDYGPSLYAYLSKPICMADLHRTPLYVKLCQRLSSVALRHKIPGLRYIHDRSTLPTCHWCQGASMETSIHLLFCSGQPFTNLHRLRLLTDAISAEAHCDPEDSVLLKSYIARLDWPGLTPDTLQDLLRWIATVIEQYRVAAQDASGDVVDVLSSTILHLRI